MPGRTELCEDRVWCNRGAGHVVVGARPAGCGPSPEGDALALGAHSGSLTALIAASAKSLSARIGVAPYLPAKYPRPIASSMRGLRSESAYSLLAPSSLFSVNQTWSRPRTRSSLESPSSDASCELKMSC